MEEKRTIRIKTYPGIIRLAAKNKGDVSIKNIQLKLVWGYCWWQGFPQVETFLELLEKSIKQLIYAVYPHQELFLDYDIFTNDLLEESSKVEIFFNHISADQKEFELIGDVLVLQGPDLRGTFSKMTSFRRKIKENIQKTI
ncbi:hypothetical protein [Methanobacterium alcaliphilum]|uniref:hypothetical protein n=1 Tax=Methanobacterium alcaliphilum TaxID=392018 RepID=UPI00200B9224|nr:hypothetical protein [Methanobacterium alcaliphilum]MCK9150349.1 hypothetical protein [Methanobacterium alcaliphilum]